MRLRSSSRVPQSAATISRRRCCHARATNCLRWNDNTPCICRDPLKVKFHAHLNSMEESMNATKREKMDVESLTRQLETGRTKATLELQASENYRV